MKMSHVPKRESIQIIIGLEKNRVSYEEASALFNETHGEIALISRSPEIGLSEDTRK